jgi:hypothetical protein
MFGDAAMPVDTELRPVLAVVVRLTSGENCIALKAGLNRVGVGVALCP